MTLIKEIFRTACAVMLIGALTLTGCASIVSGSRQLITVNSDPAEASVQIVDSSGVTVYDSHTPATVLLKKGSGYFQGENYRVIVKKDGYKQQEVLIRSDLQIGWYVVGNIFVGGLIGWLIVDPLTGAMWTLSPEVVNAKLPNGLSMNLAPGEIRVVLLSEVPDTLLSHVRQIN